MKQLLILVIALLLLNACTPITDELQGASSSKEFIRMTVEEVLANPSQFDAKNVVIESKLLKREAYPFRDNYKVYDVASGLQVEEFDMGSMVRDQYDPVSIGKESNMNVFGHTKEWRWIPEEMMNDPYLIRETSAMSDNFFEDVYMDFYGTIILEPVCTCTYYDYDELTTTYNLGEFEENAIEAGCNPWGNCRGVWRYEIDIPERACEEYAKNVDEAFSLCQEGGDCLNGRYAQTVWEENEKFVLDPEGNPLNPNLRFAESEGENYFFETISCENRRYAPVMQFIDAKLKYSEKGIFNISYVDCFDLGPIKDSPGRSLTRCKHKEYTEI